MATRHLDFVRLTEIAVEDILAHMTDPRVAPHLPLLRSRWTTKDAEAFVAAKQACWTRDGLGHWAFLADGAYVGWGGFQLEDEEWDFGLVLTPEAFGLGPAIARKALAFARNDSRIPFVTFLLAPTRRSLRAFERLGAIYVGEVESGGEVFRKFRLETASAA